MVAWMANLESPSRYLSTLEGHRICKELGTATSREYCSALFRALQALYIKWEIYKGFGNGTDRVAATRHCSSRKGKELDFEKIYG